MKHASRSPHSSQLFLTANEKDFSLSLEMTMRGKGFAIGKAAFSLLPVEGGARRGGGWMGIAVFPKQSLPRVGKVAIGASRIGF